jgi:hypothetical protein
MFKESLLSAYSLARYSMLRWLDFIKHLNMVFKLLNFMSCAIKKDQLLLLLKLLLVIHLEGSLLLAGILVTSTRMILSHSYSLLTSKPNTLLLVVTSMPSIVVRHLALGLVVPVTIASLYMKTRMLALVVMSDRVMNTTFLQVQMGIIQYWLMAIQTFKLLKSKYT